MINFLRIMILEILYFSFFKKILIFVVVANSQQSRILVKLLKGNKKNEENIFIFEALQGCKKSQRPKVRPWTLGVDCRDLGINSGENL